MPARQGGLAASPEARKRCQYGHEWHSTRSSESESAPPASRAPWHGKILNAGLARAQLSWFSTCSWGLNLNAQSAVLDVWMSQNLGPEGTGMLEPNPSCVYEHFSASIEIAT